MTATLLGRQRRRTELSLGLLVVLVTVGGYVLVALADGPELPPDLTVLLGWVFGLYVVAHVAVRRLAPDSDATLLPLAALLNGIGFVTIARLDRELARVQSVWVAVGVAAFVATLVLVRDIRILERYRYTLLLLGVALLLLPMLPGIGRTVNGARLWTKIGPLTFQPGEAAKILLVAFFAAYLVDKREVLSAGRRRIAGMFVPALRDLGPLLLAWGFAILVLVYEKDLGSSLLFFGVFAAMLYMATRRSWYLLLGLVLLVIAALFAYNGLEILHLNDVTGFDGFGHVQTRVHTWTNPWRDPQGEGFQIIQSWYAFGTGGLGGTGLGLGDPTLIPNASTDFVFSAIGEELGLFGTLGVVAAFLLLTGSGYRIAVDATRPFAKLFAAGLATIIGFQTFLILGGVTRLIPLTGITLPFVSYGGSSLVANFVALALLLRISDDTARAQETSAPPFRKGSTLRHREVEAERGVDP